MDQHPVPQDITGFQFKLVGDMTLKQFGYLAAGSILAFFFYSLDWHPLVKFPLAFICGMAGIALAFIPINERPLETWIVNFFLSIYRPTQYVWKKTPQKLDFFDFSPGDPTPVATQEPTPRQNPTEKLDTYLDTLKGTAPTPPMEPPDVDSLLQNRVQNTGFAAPPSPDDLKSEEPEKNDHPLTVEELLSAREPQIAPAIVSPGEAPKPELSPEEKNKKLLEQINQIKAQLHGIAPAPIPTLDPTISPDKLATQNNILQNEVDRLKKELRLAKQGITPSDPNARVRFSDKVPIQSTTDGKMPPNTVYGVIDDSTGIPLPNVVVLIKDTSGTPVRALRTNKLGQFIATTPLANGTYYIELEREGLEFDVIELTLTGQPLDHLEIKAK